MEILTQQDIFELDKQIEQFDKQCCFKFNNKLFNIKKDPFCLENYSRNIVCIEHIKKIPIFFKSAIDLFPSEDFLMKIVMFMFSNQRLFLFKPSFFIHELKAEERIAMKYAMDCYLHEYKVNKVSSLDISDTFLENCKKRLDEFEDIKQEYKENLSRYTDDFMKNCDLDKIVLTYENEENFIEYVKQIEL